MIGTQVQIGRQLTKRDQIDGMDGHIDRVAVASAVLHTDRDGVAILAFVVVRDAFPGADLASLGINVETQGIRAADGVREGREGISSYGRDRSSDIDTGRYVFRDRTSGGLILGKPQQTGPAGRAFSYLRPWARRAFPAARRVPVAVSDLVNRSRFEVDNSR